MKSRIKTRYCIGKNYTEESEDKYIERYYKIWATEFFTVIDESGERENEKEKEILIEP